MMMTLMMMVTMAPCVHNLMYSNGHLETPSAALNHTLRPRSSITAKMISIIMITFRKIWRGREESFTNDTSFRDFVVVVLC